MILSLRLAPYAFCAPEMIVLFRFVFRQCLLHDLQILLIQKEGLKKGFTLNHSVAGPGHDSRGVLAEVFSGKM